MLVHRNFEGSVPEPAELDETDRQILNNVESTLTSMESSLESCSFREALQKTMALARQANVYLDEKSPWKVYKEDRQAASKSLYTAINIISGLKTAMYPFIPFSSQKVHEYLGFNGKVEDFGWKTQPVPPGQKLREPKPLFTKLDERIIEEETKHIGT